MPTIPLHLKQRIAQHLGYSRPRGVNPALLQIFNQNASQIMSNDDIYGKTGQSITTLIDRCDSAFRLTDFSDTAAFSQFQQILGDVNRQTRTLSIEDIAGYARELYLIACDDLAKFIHVPNLQRTEVASRYQARLGDTFIQVSPSIPDTCISDRLYLWENYV